MSIGHVSTQFFRLNAPFVLESGDRLEGVAIAYETYGTLNAEASNAVLLFHALTGSQHAAGINPHVPGVEPLWTAECELGWWDDFIGPGLALDTDQYFVICANYIGSCYGSTGPHSINPETGTSYGSAFPPVTAWDVVKSQLLLLDALGIDCLHAVIGGSLGGMLALLLATRMPQRVHNIIPMATGMQTTVLHRILNFEQAVAIRNDPDFKQGDYYDIHRPKTGLALARMISHKTFVSLEVLEDRARQEIMPRKQQSQNYPLSHSIESYMLHQGQKFADRFDANSYLCVMDMWQHFDLGETKPELFLGCDHQTYLVFSIDSDVCFYPEEQLAIVQALKSSNIEVTYITVHSDKGHDSFLLEPELYTPYIQFVLGGSEFGT
ncbi:MAG: homoserine O-acetyltransferase [Thermosynechococcaceae cyanobacterium]